MNTFGQQLRLTTFGESHGAAIGGVIDGLPAGMVLDLSRVAAALKRRREGDTLHNAVTRRHESDEVEWLSGLLDGVTTGQPLTFLIRNEDARSEDYAPLRELCRPGHADYSWRQRYGMHDWRGGGRASGRETVARVVAGAIAQQLCEQRWPQFSIQASVDDSHCVVCRINGVPAGIGNPIFERLNARLAYAMMSIPSSIGFEMGDGFAAAPWDGATWRDEWNSDGTTRSSHCGGVQGGVSNGMPIRFRVAFHAPVTTVGAVTTCLHEQEKQLQDVTIDGRHDSDHIGRLPVIVEAMACLVLGDFLLQPCFTDKRKNQ